VGHASYERCTANGDRSTKCVKCRFAPLYPRGQIEFSAHLPTGPWLSAAKLAALTTADNSNPLFLIVVSAILGAVLGYLMGCGFRVAETAQSGWLLTLARAAAGDFG
jgi:hypothetical protein